MLDKLGIETELANRVAPGRGLAAPRFRWVPFVDALLFPLDNSGVAEYTPDRKIFFAREDALLKRYMTARQRRRAVPASLDDYLSQVVTPTLERLKREGAVAVKYEAAYLRPLNFTRGDRAAADRAYAQVRSVRRRRPTPSTPRSRMSSFTTSPSRRGDSALPVHIHTGYGCGGYFEIAGANPLLLEPILDDASLRKTKFVLLHGGAGPFATAIAPLLMKPNVYTDFSEQTWLLPTSELAQIDSLLARVVSGEGAVRHGSVAGHAVDRLGGDRLADDDLGARSARDRAHGNDERRRDHARARDRYRARGTARECGSRVRLDFREVEIRVGSDERVDVRRATWQYCRYCLAVLPPARALDTHPPVFPSEWFDPISRSATRARGLTERARG